MVIMCPQNTPFRIRMMLLVTPLKAIPMNEYKVSPLTSSPSPTLCTDLKTKLIWIGHESLLPFFTKTRLGKDSLLELVHLEPQLIHLLELGI